MKDKIMNNLALKILSLLIAVIIWITIVNLDNPIVTKKFENITVTVLNGKEITEKDKVYTITSGDVVDIWVTGRRSFVYSLNRSDLVAYADLSELSFTDAVYIEPAITKATATEYKVELGSTKMLKVELEDKVSNKFPVEISLSGDIDSRYTISEKSASPNMITVSGAESVMNKILKVVVDVNVQGRTASFNKSISKNDFLVYDNNKDLIDNTKLEFSVDEIIVDIKLQKTKEVKLKINKSGSPKNGYEVSEFDYEPKKIVVSGDDETLNNLTEIVYEYDISGKFEDIEEYIPIGDKLLEVIKSYGVYPVDDSQTIAISVKFEKLETTEVSIKADDIQYRNLESGYQVEINTPSVLALVQGSGNMIKNLSAADLEPYIDLTSQTKGTSLVGLQFANTKEYTIIGQYSINVTMSEIIAVDSSTYNVD